MTDKTMTLERVRDEMIQQVAACDYPTMGQVSEWMNAITLHLSQPAERGEAVEVSVLREQLKGIADTSCRNCDGSGIFYGNVALCSCVLHKIAPPPAAGVPNQRALHVLKAAFDEPQFAPEDFTSVDTRLYFWRTGWNACCQTMLSATPSPTIDVAAVREVCHVLREITINGHAPFTAQADKLALAIGDAK